MKYKIIGKYQGQTETLDETDDKKEAEYLRQEYVMAFGPGWTITIRGCRK